MVVENAAEFYRRLLINLLDSGDVRLEALEPAATTPVINCFGFSYEADTRSGWRAEGSRPRSWRCNNGTGGKGLSPRNQLYHLGLGRLFETDLNAVWGETGGICFLQAMSGAGRTLAFRRWI